MLFSDFPLDVGFVLLSWIDMYIICDRYCIELSLLTWVLSVFDLFLIRLGYHIGYHITYKTLTNSNRITH